MKLGSNDISAVKIGSTDVNKVYIGSTEVWSSFTGLLDTYTGAAAAYSLRLLRADYTGDAIEVRRASDNSTQDIGFVNNELDTTSLESFCSGTNGFVTTWYDQSGNGYDATQGTASNQPQIVSSGSVITKGTKPSVLFNGNQELVNNTRITDTTITLISVINSENTSQDSVSIQISTDIGFSQGFGGAGTADVFSTRSRDSSSSIAKGKNNTGTAQLLAFNYGTTGQSNNLYVNGVEETDNIQCRLNGSNLNFVTIGSRGGSNYLEGKYSEAIVYLSDQSSNRTGIETNINDFYSIY